MSKPTELKPGDKAPTFTATAVGGEYGGGQTVSLKDFAGRKVVLYFYPKDDTPGCTTQACGLRDAWPQVGKKAAIFGVSIDSAKSHAKFIAKHALPFPLLVDEEQKLVQGYGVWVEKSMYGKTHMGTERTTFIIGADAKIEAILRKVKPAEHAEQLLAALSLRGVNAHFEDAAQHRPAHRTRPGR
jgi:peroxiredoxin Q/BCP